MPVRTRALIIGMTGPAIQTVGLMWQGVHMAVSHWGSPLTARHLMYEPGVLLIVVGFLVTVVCLPVALEVSRASQAEVEIPVYAPEPASGVQEAGSYSSPRSR
jgi:hypothetical protein